MTPGVALDVRCDFPFLDRLHNGKSLVYLDSAATTQKPRQVVNAVSNLYASGIANVHRAVNFLSDEVTEEFERARQIAARFIGGHAREIVFVPGTTYGINVVASSLARAGASRVLTTTLQHHSNLLPWLSAGSLDFVPWDASGVLDMAAFEKKLKLKPDLVAMAHASNLLGVIHPVEEIASLCRKYEVPLLIDASQSIAHAPIDVSRVTCDFLVFSSHKIYGPGGVGVLYINSRRLEKLAPSIVGGSMVKEVHAESYVLNDIPHRFEAGTPNIEGVVGMGAALRYVSGLGLDVVRAHEDALLDHARKRLPENSRVSLHSAPAGVPSAPIVTFQVKGLDPGAVAKTLASRSNVIVRSGFHCAQPAHDQLGLGPTIRASFGVYNTTEEIDIMVDTLRSITSFIH